MVVKVEEIDEDGLVLDEPVSERLLSEALTGQGRDTGFRADRPAPLKASFRKISGSVLLQAELTPHVTAPCKRCLKDVAMDLPVQFTLNLVPQPPAVKEEGEDGQGGPGEDARSQKRDSGGSFALRDADREYFDGRTIDLDPIVQEQVLLALPVSVLCKDECKGLCPVCGQDLNEAECGCERKVVDPRLAVLKSIKLN
ncbi:MAG TPA: DUF177 domain-containing protein [Myxococcales bacterium]|nr:DUF177 domain-containing protein [Myxococcales bacterium]